MNYFYRLKRFLRSRLTEFKVERHYRSCSEMGVTREKREQELIVTMTTVPQRLSRTYLAIETVLSQATKPDRVILWISDKIDKEQLPQNLESLVNRGLTLRYCEDIGPHTKIWYALQEFPNACLVTADDDAMYPQQWLTELYESWKKDPGAVHCHRALRITTDTTTNKLTPSQKWPIQNEMCGPSMDLWATNVYGTLYSPGTLHPEVFNRAMMLSLCPSNDDIWLKTMSLYNNVAVKRIKSSVGTIDLVPNSQKVYGLEKQNVGEGKDNIQFRDALAFYELEGLFTKNAS